MRIAINSGSVDNPQGDIVRIVLSPSEARVISQGREYARALVTGNPKDGILVAPVYKDDRTSGCKLIVYNKSEERVFQTDAKDVEMLVNGRVSMFNVPDVKVIDLENPKTKEVVKGLRTTSFKTLFDHHIIPYATYKKTARKKKYPPKKSASEKKQSQSKELRDLHRLLGQFNRIWHPTKLVKGEYEDLEVYVRNNSVLIDKALSVDEKIKYHLEKLNEALGEAEGIVISRDPETKALIARRKRITYVDI